MSRVIVVNNMVYSCGMDGKLKKWSILDKQLRYEFTHGNNVYEMTVGREETPLYNRVVSVSSDKFCRILDLETGAELRKINFDSQCWSLAVDKSQTVIAVGTDKKLTFIETANLTKVKEIALNDVYALAFNKRNDCLLAVTKNGEVHSFKF